MKLQVFVLSAGNPILFETLDSIKENVKVPHELCVWYHALDEDHPIDLDFFNRIRSYTDDVILATKNQRCPAASGYAKIYKDYDYMLSIDEDMYIKKESVETMLNVFTVLRRVGYVGEGVKSVEMKNIYEIDPIDNYPDWGGMINREAINEVGGNCAFFPTYGFDHAEWLQRLHVNSWRIVNYKGLFLHGGKEGKGHEIADKTKDFRMIQGESFGKMQVCAKLQFQHYNWFSNKI